jgi:CTP:molybdopterin cytidylyltransferase MocA
MKRPKLLLPWGETSVLGHLLGTWEKVGERTGVFRELKTVKTVKEGRRLRHTQLKLGVNEGSAGEKSLHGSTCVGQISVVCAVGDAAVLGELDRLGFPAGDRILNARPEEGMFGSVRCAAQWSGWVPGLTHWAITLGDQPHLRLETLRALIELSAGQPGKVCQPRRLGHLRHPVVLPKAVFLELRDAKTPTLKDFLAKREIASCEVDDSGLDLDIDEPADYERALALQVKTKGEKER